MSENSDYKLLKDVFSEFQIPKKLTDIFEYGRVQRAVYDEQDSQILLIYVLFDRLFGRKLIKEAEDFLNTQLQKNGTALYCVFRETYSLPDTYRLQNILSEYKDSLTDELTDGLPIEKNILSAGKWKALSDTGIEVTIPDNLVSRSREHIWADGIRQILLKKFSFDCQVSILFTEKKIPGQLPLEEKTDNQKKTNGEAQIPQKSEGAEKAQKSEESEKAQKSEGLNRAKKSKGLVKTLPEKKADPNLIYGRPFNDAPMRLSDFSIDEEGEIVVSGTIFDLEIKELRKEKSIITFCITDSTDSIPAKLFLGNEEAQKLFNEMTAAHALRIKGFIRYDAYQKETVLQNFYGIYKTEIFSGNFRIDNAPVKRVELHCHTTASEMDALTNTDDLLITVAKWGMPAIAITDHGNTQSFPDIWKMKNPKGIDGKKDKKLKKEGLIQEDLPKVIYGMEGYIVDDTREIVTNPTCLPLTSKCVVFDLETTGLSAVNDRIIEIGAVKMEDGKIIDRFSAFVKPDIPIPYHIEQLTGIANQTVENAKNIHDILPEFLRFIDGSYLVAHNASFDVPFVMENMKREYPELSTKFTYVDTVGIGRFLLPQLSNFKLDHVAKELKISLENHHRAVDDAECTALIYLNFIPRLQKQGIDTLEDIVAKVRFSDEAISKMHPCHVTLLVKNEEGRVNLNRLITKSNLQYFGGSGITKRPLIPKSVLSAHREGLIVGSACVAGELYSALLDNAGNDVLDRLCKFYDYYEIQPVCNNAFLIHREGNHIDSEEDIRNINRRVVALGELYQKPVVATSDVHFLNPEDGIYRDILLSSKKMNDEDPTPLYLRTTEEMLEEMGYLGQAKAYEVVVTNTRKIADEIEEVAPLVSRKAPPEIENSDNLLHDVCYARAHELYGDPLPEIVQSRLDKELNSIISNGYSSLYMIAKKLIAKSLHDGYFVGSRGSVGSSFVATMLGITEVNPLPAHYACPNCKYSDFDSDIVKEYESQCGFDLPDRECPKCGTKMNKYGFKIPFETFLGFKGDKEPDIDLNFSSEYQAKAHAYTEVIFGKGQTFRAGTVSAVQEKTAFGYTEGYFEDKGIQKRRCEILRLARNLTGVKKTTGQHPGGIVVLPIGEEMEQFTPVQHPPKSNDIITTHYEYHAIEQNLLKLDILGHENPTLLHFFQQCTGVDPLQYPLDDKRVISLYQSTEALGITPDDIHGVRLGALGIPEFGTDFAMQMTLECKPETFADLVKITGIAHGTDLWAGNNQDLFREGKASLRTAVCCRDDIMEHLIKAGFEDAKAFKISEAVRKGKGLQDEWAEEMTARGIPDWYIGSCRKIKYLFPKAHAAAYVTDGYRVAYTKLYYPLVYYAAYFSIRGSADFDYETMCFGIDVLRNKMNEYAKLTHPTDKEKDAYGVMRIVEEMYARGFSFVPVDIYKADATRFTVVDDKHLMPALTSISGMGQNAAESIVIARTKSSPFTSVSDLKSRGKVSQTVADTMKRLHILENLPEDNQISLFDSLV